jgi:hypothetical protein
MRRLYLTIPISLTLWFNMHDKEIDRPVEGTIYFSYAIHFPVRIIAFTKWLILRTIQESHLLQTEVWV